MIVLNAFTLGIQVEVEFDCRRTNTCEEHIVFFIAEQVLAFMQQAVYAAAKT